MIKSKSRQILDATPDLYFIYNRDGIIMDYKPSKSVRLALPPEKFLGKHLSQVVPPHVSEGGLECIRKVLDGDEDAVFEYRLPIDGEEMFFESRFTLLGEDNILSIVRDITETYRAREALKRSESEKATILDTICENYIYQDPDMRIIWANKAAVDAMGLNQEDVKGQYCYEAWCRRSEPCDKCPVIAAKDTKRLRQEEITFPDGRVWDVRGYPVFDDEGEVSHIIAVGSDITEKKRAENSTIESEERFRTIFHMSPEAIILSKVEDGAIVDVNEAFIERTGYGREEVIGKNPLEVGVRADPERRDRFFEDISKADRLDNVEIISCFKDGSVRAGLMSVRVITLAGVPHHLIIVRDITEMKKAAENIKRSLREKEVLLKEIHHRVKNNLQVVSGLLNLQAHHLTEKKEREVYKESQNRIISMALIHEELYKAKDLARIDFAEYIRNLASNLFASYGADRENVGLALDTEAIEIVVDTAIPCGLMINEIISNSLKHAFPGDRKGEIHVGFRTLGDREYELTVKDDGVGLPADLDIRNTNTLGMQLITVLSGQLGAVMNVDGNGGTGYMIRFREYLEAGSALG